MSLAGLEWVPAVKREERSAISTLMEVINGNAKALESLETLIISNTSRWGIPMRSLRSGPEAALKVLSDVPFLSRAGPGREDMHAMFEVLCNNRSGSPGADEIDLSFAAVSKIFSDAARPGVSSQVKCAAWQASVARLMTHGTCRRAHFKVVMGAEVLRNLSYSAQELHDIGFSSKELKAGFFTARELKAAGLAPAALKQLGYTPRELREAEISPEVMRALRYTAKQLRSGGYTAQETATCYSLSELKEGLYTAAELAKAGFLIAALREAKFSALELRRSSVFSMCELICPPLAPELQPRSTIFPWHPRSTIVALSPLPRLPFSRPFLPPASGTDTRCGL